MPNTESILYNSLLLLLLTPLFPSTTHADESINNSNCLQHLGGGGFGDTECYENNTKILEVENNLIYKNIKKTIPINNKEEELLHSYMQVQRESIKFCILARDAGANWTPSDGSMYPMLYAKCVYNIRKSQNTFLKEIMEMSK